MHLYVFYVILQCQFPNFFMPPAYAWPSVAAASVYGLLAVISLLFSCSIIVESSEPVDLKLRELVPKEIIESFILIAYSSFVCPLKLLRCDATWRGQLAFVFAHVANLTWGSQMVSVWRTSRPAHFRFGRCRTGNMIGTIMRKCALWDSPPWVQIFFLLCSEWIALRFQWRKI